MGSKKTPAATAKRRRRARDADSSVQRAAARLAGKDPAAMTPAELDAVCRAVLTVVGTGTGTAGGDAGTPAREGPGAARAIAGGHAAVLAPFWWIAQADLTALAYAYATHHGGPGAAACGITAAALTGWAGIRTLARSVPRKNDGEHERAARAAARRRAIRAWLAAAAWGPAAIWWTTTGPYGIVQETLVAGGLALAAGHLHAHRRRHVPARARLTAGPQAAAAGPDERLELFRRRFIDAAGTGRRAAPLAGAQLHDFAGVRDGQGFTFSIALDPASGITRSAVVTLRAEIAALYDVPAEQVLIDHAARRSESRAQVTVLTAADAYAEPDRWDGVSTYDPATGCVDLGRYGDGEITHVRMHAPGSGTWGSIIVGGPGTGKTGDAHVMASEYGIATLCAVCGPARGCPACDPQRICFLIMCDPQRQPFAVWRGRADLTAWGPLATAHVLAMVSDALAARSDEMSGEEWTDGKGRTCYGKGWFDPEPRRPAVQMFIDEWPIVVASPAGERAVADAGSIEKERRKSGGAINWIAQLPDAGETGDSRVNREVQKSFNVIGHRLDGTSRSMVGLEGDVRDLPAGVYGAGYISGHDNRSGVMFRTKTLPESASDGIDVRDIADRIAATPVTLDEAVEAVFRRYGYTGRGQVIDDEFVLAWRKQHKRHHGAARPEPADDPRPDQGTPAAAAAPGPVSTGTLEAVARALDGHAADHQAPAELFDVMAATGLAAGTAGRALAALAADGRARQAGPGAWAPARAQAEGAPV